VKLRPSIQFLLSRDARRLALPCWRAALFGAVEDCKLSDDELVDFQVLDASAKDGQASDRERADGKRANRPSPDGRCQERVKPTVFHGCTGVSIRK
jgi:hypothetical protein